jgi:hypothetical protein
MFKHIVLTGVAAVGLIAAAAPANAEGYSYMLSDSEQQQVRQCFEAPSGDVFADCVVEIGKQSLRAAGPQVVAMSDRAVLACTDRNSGLDNECAKREGDAIADAVMVALSGYAASIASEPPPDAAFSFSPACWHPSGAHLCALLAVPASDNE